MALINLGAGLSELGKSVASTAQAWTLEAQRQEADLEKAKLLNQLTGERESAGRREAHGYASALQKEKQDFERPKQDAETRRITSQTDMSEEEIRRRRESGDQVSTLVGGGSGNSYAERIKGYESRGGKMIPNELGSGAFGPYQFMPSTWSDVRAKNAELNLPEDMKQASAEQHKAAFDRFTAGNREALQKAGIDATPANLYLAHRFGAGGAAKLINADDAARLADVLPPEWQKQNPDMRGQTVASFKRLAEERMKGVSTEETGGGGILGQLPADLRATISALAKTDPDKALQLMMGYVEKQQTLNAPTASERARQEYERLNPQQRATRQQMIQEGQPLPKEAALFDWLQGQTPEAQKRFMDMINEKKNVETKVENGQIIVIDKGTGQQIGQATPIKGFTKQTPEAFKKLETEIRTVGGAIDRFEDVVKKYGGGSLQAFLNDPTSKEAQEYNTAFTAMKTALRSEAFINTGVLQPAEMQMLDKELLAPTTIRGLLSNPEAYKAKFDELRRYLDNKIQSSYASHGQEIPGELKFYKEATPQDTPRISTPKEYDALKSGTKYIAPDGSVRTKR